MGACLERKIRVVSNAGGLNPKGLADALQTLAQKLGLTPRIAYIEGDDLMPRLAELHGSPHLGGDGEEGPVGEGEAQVVLGGPAPSWFVEEYPSSALPEGQDVSRLQVHHQEPAPDPGGSHHSAPNQLCELLRLPRFLPEWSSRKPFVRSGPPGACTPEARTRPPTDLLAVAAPKGASRSSPARSDPTLPSVAPPAVPRGSSRAAPSPPCPGSP